MKVISAIDVNMAFGKALLDVQMEGVTRPSRNGPVLEFPTPVTTRYGKPQQRILFNDLRNHNSIFAWAEALWMLAGRDDLAFLVPMNKGMEKYSDDGSTVRGSAYGKRWRGWFGHDQLERVIERLRANKEDRRLVLQHWDAHTDNTIDSKDVPCNTVVYPYVRPSNNHAGYALDLTVSCRSNDIVFGAYGSNAVHFSILQEVIAAAIGVPVGEYYQVSNSLHAYTEAPVTAMMLEARMKEHPSFDNAGLDYTALGVSFHPLIAEDETYERFMNDVYKFFEIYEQTGYSVMHSYSAYSTKWFRSVWTPAWNSFILWKLTKDSPNRFENVSEVLADCQAEDLQLDLLRWYSRRAKSAS